MLIFITLFYLLFVDIIFCGGRCYTSWKASGFVSWEVGAICRSCIWGIAILRSVQLLTCDSSVGCFLRQFCCWMSVVSHLMIGDYLGNNFWCKLCHEVHSCHFRFKHGLITNWCWKASWINVIKLVSFMILSKVAIDQCLW